MDKEKLIAQIILEAEKEGEPLTREEAEEVAEMELKAKGVKNYTTGEKPKSKKSKERKIDLEKLDILSILGNALENDLSIEVEREKEVALHFKYNENEYSVKLIKHRPPK